MEGSPHPPRCTVITGASSGTGKALANALAAQHQPLCLLARHPGE